VAGDDVTGQPAKALVLSPDDPLVAQAAKLGDPPVIDFDGVLHEIRTSPLVPAGQAYVVDLASLGLTAVP
jgi:hypothetical protein